ncbi:hypothetical protein NDU88_007512 [Pleurodeles waltl]|uniref:Uncharacterized protein n=1 Tax=Pleurodeles waltl TaxID=8319 RepID=A0AAV7PLI8_PLEWA|nr:hypothetical protein NDU88_007512 [Pleurodeles waltl]
MEEVDTGEHQADLKRMLAQMRVEALRRGKDWLRAKMEERIPEGDVKQVSDLNPPTREDAGDPGSELDPTQKARKRQRTEGKPAKKVAKRNRGANWSTMAAATVEAPESSSSWKPAEGKHISEIITECLKSFAPLLLKGSGAGQSQGYAKKGGSQDNLNKGDGAGAQEVRSERAAAGDPMLAWLPGGNDQDTVRSVGQSPEAYVRPSLGLPRYDTKGGRFGKRNPFNSKRKNMAQGIYRHCFLTRNLVRRSGPHRV